MKAQIEAILDGIPDVRVEPFGWLWQISVGGGALGGSSEDGPALAESLKKQWLFIRDRERAAEVPPPPFIPPTPEAERVMVPDEELTARIAELEARLAEAEAALEEAHAPQAAPDLPAEVVDILTEHGLNFGDSYERVNEVLVKRYADAMGNSEYARGNPDGTHGGKSVIEWLAIAARADSGVKWNRGRAAETI
jgi:hypothetical protein